MTYDVACTTVSVRLDNLLTYRHSEMRKEEENDTGEDIANIANSG